MVKMYFQFQITSRDPEVQKMESPAWPRTISVYQQTDSVFELWGLGGLNPPPMK